MNNTNIQIDISNIPRHIAIIMDGNGRWAKKRFMPRTFGHKAGVETIREIVQECSRLGVKYLTLYAFSTENWKRPTEEVNALMTLLVEYLKKEVKQLHENNVRLNAIGDISYLPKVALEKLNESIEITKNNTGLVLSLALNYGSRNDIKHAIIDILRDYDEKKFTINDIDQDFLKKYLTTKDLPDPDILIRTSGEYRISNFLLWEIAYTELYFTNVFWPDFKKNHLHEAILDYQNRERRFGSV
ncbi:undecaprenyl diphosphate synthase [Alkalithermobacter thermoalcaliphilus JW-YL-7 = DSM 7308]|uniref:Isoprenyl transferase n=1 Tax=Alkalithermobacter thermoalcaliphilus JW-YL-7 = DSM 7308 TaxID=1121328 RepID=A0A150FQC2_CLOPD|nr:Undecaprenyl pyrophosphate synthase [[Clostridium] paradoxum JW-YL-7 = DSM 7308]SHK59880.1 undecaprenyl diphosphate synthase [[Clostridium] paradoxum JW-YL-7 = DSM 7308]